MLQNRELLFSNKINCFINDVLLFVIKIFALYSKVQCLLTVNEFA